nr:Holliday junction resolvase RuvX [Anaerophilus nitritogenes]
MMRTMGLDVGDKTIGVAVSDAMGMIAQGVETIRRVGKKADYKRLQELIEEKCVTKIVVGLPKNMNGTLGPQGEKVLSFVEGLNNRFKVEIILWDERLTTVAAERTLIEGDVRRENRKKVIDMVAATYILQGYLDAQKF